MENNNSVLHKISEREDPIDTEKMAYAELKAFEKDNLKNKRKRNNSAFKMARFLAWFLFTSSLLIFACWLCQFFLPKNLIWLEEDQLNAIHQLLTSCIVGGIVGKYFDGIVSIIKPRDI